MGNYYKVKKIPLSKYGTITYEELGIQCTFCYAGTKIFVSKKGKLTVSEHYNARVQCVTVDGIVNGEKIFKSFENSYGFWAGCDYVKDLLKTKNIQPIVKPIYEC